VSRIHIPALVDLLPVEDPTLVASLADDVRLDRDYRAQGPLLNRLIVGRIRKVLVVGATPLPPVAPRGPARPLPAQQSLEARLAPIAAALASDVADLAPLGDYVHGEGGDPGPLAQQAVGRLFEPAYAADAASWRAAVVLDQAPRSFNPFLLLWWWITGAVARSQKLLAQKVSNDPSGVHGTGVAVHNIVSGLETMRRLYADPQSRGELTPEAAAAACLVAPEQVLRQPRMRGESLAGEFDATTLVLLKLSAAHKQAPTAELAFMAQSWSRCPAHAWVPALLASVWRAAVGAS
jgi:hypothetical protein